MFRHTVEGEFITQGKMATTRYYEATVDLEIEDVAVARGVIQNGLITDILRRKEENFKRVRTCQIVKTEKIEDSKDQKAEADSGDVDPDVAKLLAEATELGCVPVNYASYGDDKTRKLQLTNAINRKIKRMEKQDAKDGKQSKEKAVIDQGFID